MCARPQNGSQHCVLLIEDGPLLAKFLSEYLELTGFSVRHRRDFDEALEDAIESHFDVVLTDAIVPGKINLEGFLRHLKSTNENGSTPVVVLTAFPGYQVAGSHTVIEKPFDLEKMSRILRSLLDQE